MTLIPKRYLLVVVNRENSSWLPKILFINNQDPCIVKPSNLSWFLYHKLHNWAILNIGFGNYNPTLKGYLEYASY